MPNVLDLTVGFRNCISFVFQELVSPVGSRFKIYSTILKCWMTMMQFRFLMSWWTIFFIVYIIFPSAVWHRLGIFFFLISIFISSVNPLAVVHLTNLQTYQKTEVNLCIGFFHLLHSKMQSKAPVQGILETLGDLPSAHPRFLGSHS